MLLRSTDRKGKTVFEKRRLALRCRVEFLHSTSIEQFSNQSVKFLADDDEAPGGANDARGGGVVS